jgi:AbrB family looped-hinge helix DNA binding protein
MAIDLQSDIRMSDRTDNKRSAVETVKVSPKFQIVIPKAVRESLKLEPGQELRIYVLNGAIRVTRPRSIKDLRGMAKGLKWKDEDRDRNDRF